MYGLGLGLGLGLDLGFNLGLDLGLDLGFDLGFGIGLELAFLTYTRRRSTSRSHPVAHRPRRSPSPCARAGNSFVL